MRWLVLLAIAGCGHTHDTFVQHVELVGRELRVVKCPVVFAGDKIEVVDRACRLEVHHLPAPVEAGHP